MAEQWAQAVVAIGARGYIVWLGSQCPFCGSANVVCIANDDRFKPLADRDYGNCEHYFASKLCGRYGEMIFCEEGAEQ